MAFRVRPTAGNGLAAMTSAYAQEGWDQLGEDAARGLVVAELRHGEHFKDAREKLLRVAEGSESALTVFLSPDAELKAGDSEVPR